MFCLDIYDKKTRFEIALSKHEANGTPILPILVGSFFGADSHNRGKKKISQSMDFLKQPIFLVSAEWGDTISTKLLGTQPLPQVSNTLRIFCNDFVIGRIHPIFAFKSTSIFK